MTVEQGNGVAQLLNTYNSTDLLSLRANHMLRTLGDEELSTLLSAGQWMTFKPDDTVSLQSTPVREILFLIEGKAKAEVSSPNNGNFAAVVNLLKAGDDIGLLSLVDGAPHSATVTALEVLRALSIPTVNMRSFLRSHPEWYRTLADVAVSRLRSSSLWLQTLM